MVEGMFKLISVTKNSLINYVQMYSLYIVFTNYTKSPRKCGQESRTEKIGLIESKRSSLMID